MSIEKRKRTTIEDIARKSGLTSATVSLIMNNKGNINKHTRERVKKIAAELNYYPNTIARALRGAKTYSIGVVIDNFRNPFFNSVFDGIEKVAAAKGYNYLVSQTHDKLQMEKEQIQFLAEHGVDGLIVLPCTQEYNHLDNILNEYKVPVVLIGNYIEGKKYDAVIADNWTGAKMAVEHLISLGRLPIYHIAGPPHQTMCMIRRKAFEYVMHKTFKDTSIQDIIFNINEMSSDEGHRIMYDIIKRNKLPLSLFVVNDDTALGVLRFCRDNSLKIPDDIAIVGFCDIDILDTFAGVALSTVRIPAKIMGSKAANLLIDRIEKSEKYPAKTIKLSVSLIVRQSTLI
ncbi:MAG: LacI family transcriptional regulator [Spirochaetes bacterium]|nr:LacI family transcriptional regulator [Spirochaetota bacterium]